jgi:hypothetical protein
MHSLALFSSGYSRRTLTELAALSLWLPLHWCNRLIAGCDGCAWLQEN